MNITEIIQLINHGMEYHFYHNNEEYWISRSKMKCYLTDVKKQYTQEFDTAQELFETGIIQGKKMIDVWQEIKDQF